MEALSPEFIRQCFDLPSLKVFDHHDDLETFLKGVIQEEGIVLLMSSGNFSGLDIRKIFSGSKDFVIMLLICY